MVLNRLLMVCSYNDVSGGHATFSHVPSTLPKRGLFVHEALMRFWT